MLNAALASERSTTKAKRARHRVPTAIMAYTDISQHIARQSLATSRRITIARASMLHIAKDARRTANLSTTILNY